MLKLKDAEKNVLERIANDKDQLLAKRATIILMSTAGAQPTNIAKEVELTPRTVRRWLRQFETKRLAIFPGLDGDDSGPEADEALASASPDSVTPSRPNGDKSAAEATAGKAGPVTPPEPAEKKKAQKGKAKSKALLYRTRKQVGLEPTDTFAEAGRKLLGFHFARMLKHESETRSGKDIEALHDMRVATRRMRAVFRIFSEAYSKKALKPLLAGLKAAGRALGPGRDMDVFMEKLRRYQQTLPESEAGGLEMMLHIWTEKRQKAREQMLDHLNSKKYGRFKKNLLKFVKTPGQGVKSLKAPETPHQLRHLAPSLIYTAYAEVRAYETVLENAPVETLHQLRISFKRLRYLLEFLREILGPEVDMVIEETKLMQDHLGDLHDAQVAGDILREFLSDWEKRQIHLSLEERQSPGPIAAYLEQQLEEYHRLITSFPDAWRNFNRPEVREKLAKAISVL